MMDFFSKALTYMSKLFSFKNTPLLLTILAVLFFYASCATTPQKNNTDYFSHNKESPVYYTRYEDAKEKLIYHLTIIQLHNPNISIVGSETHSNEEYEIIGETTKEFTAKTGAYVAINASPFSYPKTILSSRRNIEGLYIHKGNIVSEPNPNYAALCFTKEKQAFIVNSQNISDTKNAYYAFGGFWTILENNTILEFQDISSARTAVGISNDGFTLYILTVEKNSRSNGLNYMECAKILKDAGATKAIQLDGGGSTSLSLPSFIGNSVYSNRKVANNLGIILLF